MKKKVFHALSLALILVLLVTTVVVADNVQNDVVVGGTDTITAGGSTEVNYKIHPTGNDGCNVSETNKATVTINTPSEVTAEPKSLEFSECGSWESVIFSSNTPGEYKITVGVSGPGDYNTNPATFTLKVLAAPPPSDTTPPVITPSITGTLGDNGWYVGDVTVTWTVVDDESEVTSTEGCDPTTIDDDTAGVDLTCTATSAGGTASESVTIKRDATLPEITADVTPDRAESGWFNQSTGAPTVKYTCSDATSGIASCTDPYPFGEGEDQYHEGKAVDQAGNEATAYVVDIDVDLTAPDLEWLGEIENGDEFYFGFVPAAPTCEASDTLSGPDSCSVSGYSALVGTHTLTATAYDKAGNETVETREYKVWAWTLNGFYRPVEMAGVWNTVKGGSTVPLKFNIFAGTTELTSTSAVKGFSVTPMACYGGPEDNVEELATTGGTTLRYDATAGQFIQNWQTPKNPGKCYRVTMTTQDGSQISANFKLK